MASVKVAVRVRPFNQREHDNGNDLIIKMEGNQTSITNNKIESTSINNNDTENSIEQIKRFSFDHSYWSFHSEHPNYTSQEQIYYDLGQDVVDNAFDGYNSCVFAYGQTGSGKTFTMMGTPQDQGIIPRICKNLFNRIKQNKNNATYRIEVSYLEIYNEKVKDLLIKNKKQTNLKVREHPKVGPYVQDLSKHLAQDYSDLEELMNRGNAHRTTASTSMNDQSSRSHAIFSISFSQAMFNQLTPRETFSKINLVDLAGSERANTSNTLTNNNRLVEGGHINKSLVTLGLVISTLAEMSSSNKKKSYIPYRDSILTWLLKDSLGGNSKTIMIATVSPADCSYSESLSTLRYANRAKNIVNKPIVNEDYNTKLIRDLRQEIERLKSMLKDSPEIITKVQENEARVKVLTEEWTDKWKETHKILKEQRALGLRKLGFGVVLDSDLPHLIGIDDDVLSTGITLYQLRDGMTSIGTENAGTKQDIVLMNGDNVQDEHCFIELKDGIATLIPVKNALCFVNTIAIDKPTKLSQGCVVVLGYNKVFRFNDPIQVEHLRMEKENGSCSNLSKIFCRSSGISKESETYLSTQSLASSIDQDSNHCYSDQYVYNDNKHWTNSFNVNVVSFMNGLSPHQNASKSLPDLVTSDSYASQQKCDYQFFNSIHIRVKSYHLRGNGLNEHYEYEIEINLSGEKWTIYRRYKRFEELHRLMKYRYGNMIKLPYFPPKRWFNNKSERIAETRRIQFEQYLQELIKICSTIKRCPLNYKEFGHHKLTKEHLIEFAQFFEKGSFEVNKFCTS